MRAGGFAQLVERLQHPDNSAETCAEICHKLLQYGFISDADVSTCCANLDAMIDADVIPAVVATLSVHKNDADVCALACALIEDLASDATCDDIRSAGGIDAIVDALVNHREHANVCFHACWALEQLAIGSNCAAIRDACGVPAIVLALEAHQDNPEVCEYACSVLYDLAHDCCDWAPLREYKALFKRIASEHEGAAKCCAQDILDEL